MVGGVIDRSIIDSSSIRSQPVVRENNIGIMAKDTQKDELK